VAEKSKTDVLETTATRTRSLRALYPESRAPQSIFDRETGGKALFGDTASIVGSPVFNFDDENVNSNVYRKTLVSARQYEKKSALSADSETGTLTDRGLSSR
jgi:hypothetical protein